MALAIMTLVAAAVELSFSFYFLWALVWAAVQITSPWRPLKFLALTMGPVWLFKAAYDILGPQPDTNLSRWVLDSRSLATSSFHCSSFPFCCKSTLYTTLVAGIRIAMRVCGLGSESFFTLAALILSLVVLRFPSTAAGGPEIAVQRIGSIGQPLPLKNGVMEASVEVSGLSLTVAFGSSISKAGFLQNPWSSSLFPLYRSSFMTALFPWLCPPMDSGRGSLSDISPHCPSSFE